MLYTTRSPQKTIKCNFRNNFLSRFSSQLSTTEKPASEAENRSLVVTLGKGYRRLLDRYVVNKRTPVDSDDDDDTSRTMFALLWRPDSWLSD